MPSPGHNPPRIALSIDLEEYFQVEAMTGVVQRADWDALPSRIEANTHRVLEAFAAASARATFFVVGWVAERFPRLIAEVAAAGHEIGCHSYWHRPVFGLSAQEFRDDTRRAKAVIEAAAGCEVRGYRAPNFSIRTPSPQGPGAVDAPDAMDWALEVLAEAGFAYDSSVHPVRHPLYGAATAPRGPFYLPRFGLWEFPLATVALGRHRLPMAGGGYWRLAPWVYTRWAIQQALRQGLQPVCYLHPWELDPGQPRLSLPAARRFRHYVGLAGTQSKLRRLLQEFGSETLRELFSAELEPTRAGALA